MGKIRAASIQRKIRKSDRLSASFAEFRDSEIKPHKLGRKERRRLERLIQRGNTKSLKKYEVKELAMKASDMMNKGFDEESELTISEGGNDE